MICVRAGEIAEIEEGSAVVDRGKIMFGEAPLRWRARDLGPLRLPSNTRAAVNEV